MAVSGKLERKDVEQLVREVLTQRLRGGPASVGRTYTQAGGPPHPLVVNVSARRSRSPRPQRR